MLFTIRVFAGAAVAAVTLSPWFLSFCIFTFLALAIVKRLGEFRSLGASGSAAFSGRAYRAEDLPAMIAIGAASSFASAIVFTLYMHSAEVVARYSNPEYLWFLCPLLIYALGRMLLLANRGRGGRSRGIRDARLEGLVRRARRHCRAGGCPVSGPRGAVQRVRAEGARPRGASASASAAGSW